MKLRVTLVSDAAEFDAMDLRNLRYTPGPFAPAFAPDRYYDTREDGAVLAASALDGRAVLERGIDIASMVSGLNTAATAASPVPMDGRLTGSSASAAAMTGPSAAFGMRFGSDDPFAVGANAVAIPRDADGRLYAAYAQHYLLTYFPVAYPRWYVDGLGELFSTLVTDRPGTIGYGRAPTGFRQVLDRYPRTDIVDVLTGRAPAAGNADPTWTPIHAWLLTHFLFFSDERRMQLRAYLAAYAKGATLAEAATAFGDLAQLRRDFAGYALRRKPFEVMTYPADRIAQPLVRQLTRGQAAFVKGRLELGSRIAVAVPVAADATPERQLATERQAQALRAARDRWLDRLRGEAARYPREAGAQLLLAEAECRSGDDTACLLAAGRAAALDPNASAPLAWQGMALAARAARSGPDAGAADMARARGLMARANRLDNDAPLPLLAYYRSFGQMGQAPSETATDGLLRVIARVPAAPGPRLLLGEQLRAQGDTAAAAKALRPVTAGAWDSPEREAVANAR